MTRPPSARHTTPMTTETLEALVPDAVNLNDLFRRELVVLAEKLDIHPPKSWTKTQIINEIQFVSQLEEVDDEEEPPPYPFTRTKDTVNIVGFAPSWVDTPWDDEEADLWGMNALYKVAPDKNWAAWFQLHDIKKHHPHDLDEHLKFLTEGEFATFLWDKELQKYSMPRGVAYPREQVLDRFGNYFTNSVSWMLAMAIMMGYKKIGVYGIDMAQDSEYQSQRPSCEYFIGIAEGLGIEVFIPETADLLKAEYLYGYDDPSVMRAKMEARLKELTGRRNEAQRQRDEAQVGFLQITGAIEDVQYWLRNWVHGERPST